MRPILSYQTRTPQIRNDPDGTLWIDIPPVGLLRAVKVRSSVKSEIDLLVIVVVLGALLIILGWNIRTPSVRDVFFPVAVIELAVVGGTLAIVFYRARVRMHIRATATELSIEADGFGVRRRFRVARIEIGDIDARPREEDYHRPISLCIRLKRSGKAVYFLNHLPESEVRRCTGLLQQTLNI